MINWQLIDKQVEVENKWKERDIKLELLREYYKFKKYELR